MKPGNLPFEYPFQWDNESLREGAGVTPEGAAILKQRDRDLEDFLSTLGGGGGGVPTVFVASASASAKSQGLADYVCDGTDDEVEINAAIADLAATWSGRLLLSEGDFYTTTAIDPLPWGTMLQGMGLGTYIYASDLTYGLKSSASGGVSFRDFWIEGGAADGIEMHLDDLMVDVYVEGFDTCVLINGDNVQVRGSRMDGWTNAVEFATGADRGLVQGNRILGGDLVVTGQEHLITGNRLVASSAISVASGALHAALDSNFLPSGLAGYSDAGTGTMRGTNFSSGGTW